MSAPRKSTADSLRSFSAQTQQNCTEVAANGLSDSGSATLSAVGREQDINAHGRSSRPARDRSAHQQKHFSMSSHLQRESRAHASVLPSSDANPARLEWGQFRDAARKQLRVMKFGGTSVGDASCIRRVIGIIEDASRTDRIVVVVSAMGGVTNKLIEAGNHAAAGDTRAVTRLSQDLRDQHESTVGALIHSAALRECVLSAILKILGDGDRLCREVVERRQLTFGVRDAIAGLGERLSAPLIAGALVDAGVPSESIEATQLVVTDSRHGAAEPRMDLTRECCRERLRPLLRQGVVPVVTGFIGATVEGMLTTLGRGGSDYSATILGAALDADEIVIWKDVDGVLTADPRFVPGAHSIPETSYHEATELARFGAKVLHPRTLRPVMESGIPVWIRNTFAPERRGTKITPEGSARGAVKALASTSDVALVTVSGPDFSGIEDVLGRVLANAAAGGPDFLLFADRSRQNELSLIVSSELVDRVVDELRHEYARDNANQASALIGVHRAVALVTVIGQNVHEAPAVIPRTLGALAREQVETLAISQSSSHCSISFAVAHEALNVVLAIVHREFQLDLQN